MKKGILLLIFGLLVPLHAADVSDSYPSFLVHGNNQHLPPEVRARLIELLDLPKEKLWDQLLKWPTFQQMTLQQQAGFLNRLAELRQKAHGQAMKKASDLGLKLTPEQEDAFVKAYLQERIALEKKFTEETQARHRALEDEANADLTAQFADHKTPETH